MLKSLNITALATCNIISSSQINIISVSVAAEDIALEKVVGDSFNSIIKNPRSLAPTTIYYVAILVFAFIFVLVLFIGSIGTAISSYIAAPSNHLMSQIGLLTSTSLLSTVVVAAAIIFFIVIYLPSVLLSGLFLAMGSQMANKKRLSITDAFKTARSRYIPLLAAGIISTLCFLIIAGVFVGLGLLIMAASLSTVSTILLLIPLVIAAVIVLVIYAVYFFQLNAVIIIEDVGAIQGIRRSFEIASRTRLWIFILLIILAVISGILGIASTVLAIIPLAGAILAFIISVFTTTWFGIIPAYFYYIVQKAPGENSAIQKRKHLPRTT